MATRRRSLTSARSNPMLLTTGVNTQPIICEAGSAGTASRFSLRWVNYCRWTDLQSFEQMAVGLLELYSRACSRLKCSARVQLAIFPICQCCWSSCKEESYCPLSSGFHPAGWSALGFYCPYVRYNAFIIFGRVNAYFLEVHIISFLRSTLEFGASETGGKAKLWAIQQSCKQKKIVLTL